MRPQRQKIVDGKYGDCFAACIASILELPIEVILTIIVPALILPGPVFCGNSD
jgi:hypothetical protein